MISGINIISLFWVLSSIAIFCTHLLLTLRQDMNNILSLLKNLFLFGKVKSFHNIKGERHLTTEDSNPWLTTIPKSWFTHFYAVGLVVHSFVFIFLVFCLFGSPVSNLIRNLQYWAIWGASQNSEKNFNDSALPVLIVFTTEWFQMLRRLYECLFISTFSKSTMSFVHYFYGIFLYSSFGIGLLISIPVEKLTFSTPNLLESVRYILAVILFLWASHFQHKSMLTFAALRLEQKDKKPTGHFIPHGHLFELVSCPHFLCEIIIYISHCLVFKFSNVYLISVALFVLVNQTVVSVTAHKWYRENFPNYPPYRKAFLPYLW
ncbi:unnamed protein product [Lymnaea stagnalis]|uniref:Polyprenal reductase n=1 Tax=Lymnaea stagnalis TaxID=6523 RepID=A0AAV2HPK7_LYMST